MINSIGYTLPVFAVAAAKAALLSIVDATFPDRVEIDLLDGHSATIVIGQVSLIDRQTALGITYSDPGNNLDITAGTPLWAWVQQQEFSGIALKIEGGEGIGKTATGTPAIYQYARHLTEANLSPLLPNHKTTIVRFIIPAGKALAKRTSNEAFGIVEGLALLGTSGFSQPLSAAEKLADLRQELQKKVAQHSNLVFCIGAQGMATATKKGYDPDQIVQTGNWIGALLVEAVVLGAEKIVLLGYVGKLLKLAAGIFHTSSHIADGRLETLITAAVAQNLPPPLLQQLLPCTTIEAAQQLLITAGWDQPILEYLAQKALTKSRAYLEKYAQKTIPLEIVFTDRLGNILYIHSTA